MAGPDPVPTVEAVVDPSYQVLILNGTASQGIEVRAEDARARDRQRRALAPGELVRLRDVQVRLQGPATGLPAFHTPDQLLRPGDVLNHGRYEEAKERFLTQASRYGYFDGRFTQQSLRIDPQGKAFAQQLLEFPVAVPQALADALETQGR